MSRADSQDAGTGALQSAEKGPVDESDGLSMFSDHSKERPATAIRGK